jgi:glyoxylase-like metal-dependent hydrolase (beta-lactamase superfamily II)
MNMDTPLEHLHAIELPTPFPVGPITVYLAAAPGEPLTLLDTGPQTRLTQAALETGLGHLGYQPRELEQIIVSHAHVDHFGLATDLVTASNAQVLTHAWNIRALADYDRDRVQRITYFRELLRQAAVPPKVVAAVDDATDGVKRFARTVRVDRTLGDGDTLRLAGRDWQVLHTPGHASGLICLHEPTSRTLLSSDHLLADISSNPVVEAPPPGQTERLRSLALYKESLRRVAALDVALALPSHGPAIDDVSELVGRRLAMHERRQARVLDALRNGARTTWDVTYALFPDRSPLDTFLAVSEVIGHLDLLEMEGQILAEPSEGITFWVPVR